MSTSYLWSFVAVCFRLQGILATQKSLIAKALRSSFHTVPFICMQMLKTLNANFCEEVSNFAVVHFQSSSLVNCKFVSREGVWPVEARYISVWHLICIKRNQTLKLQVCSVEERWSRYVKKTLQSVTSYLNHCSVWRNFAWSSLVWTTPLVLF